MLLLGYLYDSLKFFILLLTEVSESLLLSGLFLMPEGLQRALFHQLACSVVQQIVYVLREETFALFGEVLGDGCPRLLSLGLSEALL